MAYTSRVSATRGRGFVRIVRDFVIPVRYVNVFIRKLLNVYLSALNCDYNIIMICTRECDVERTDESSFSV